MTVYRTQTYGQRRKQLEAYASNLEAIIDRYPFRAAELDDVRSDIRALDRDMKASGKSASSAYRPTNTEGL